MLSRPGTVDIAVVQVAPVCKLWGHLRVRGHAGLNRVRFRGRVQGHVLPAGAYRLRARTAGSARVVVVKLLIVEQRLNEPLRTALAAAPCARAFARSGFGASAQGAFTAGRNAGSSVTRGGTPSQEDAAVRSGGVLGADAVSGLTEARRAVPAALLVGLLAAAALLALVVLPDSAIPNARLASAVVDRRLELTLAGGALLAAVTIVYVVFGA